LLHLGGGEALHGDLPDERKGDIALQGDIYLLQREVGMVPDRDLEYILRADGIFLARGLELSWGLLQGWGQREGLALRLALGLDSRVNGRKKAKGEAEAEETKKEAEAER
jgi:hypothetical protein